MTKTWSQYLLFIGIYIALFLFLDAIPIQIDFIISMVLGAIGMIITFIYLTRQNDFKADKFYIVNLVFVVIFCAITIFYDKTFGLTDVQTIGNSVIFSNSKFYEWTLSTNHAIVISTLLLLGHVVFTKNWKSSLIVFSTILGLFLYFWAVVE